MPGRTSQKTSLLPGLVALVCLLATWLAEPPVVLATDSLPPPAEDLAAQPHEPDIAIESVEREAGGPRRAVSDIESVVDIRADAVWVEGRVLLPAGAPEEEDLCVVARGHPVRSGMSGREACHFRAPVGADGRFQVAFGPETRRGELSLEARYLYLAERSWVELEGGATTAELRPLLAGGLRARVALTGGEAIPTDLRIVARGRTKRGRLIRELEPAGDGTFTCSPLPVGESFELCASSSSHPEVSLRGVRIEPGGLTEVQLTLRAGLSIAGRVVDDRGVALKSLSVCADPISVEGDQRPHARRESFEAVEEQEMKKHDMHGNRCADGGRKRNKALSRAMCYGILWAAVAATPGFAQAGGDFNGDLRDDLAVGAPGESFGIDLKCGVVHVILGSTSGLNAAGDQFWHQDQPGVNSSCEPYDYFGYGLAMGDFDGNGHDDLAIGVAGEEVDAVAFAGAVHVLYGNGSGLTSTGDQLWHRDSPGIPRSPTRWEYFGSTPRYSSDYLFGLY